MAENLTLDGMEHPDKIPELSKALCELRTARSVRMDALRDEVAAQDVVLELMHKHGIESYDDNDIEPAIHAKISKGKEKVKVKLPNGDSDED